MTATAGNEYGCGIGCGYYGSGGSISISGGMVTATAGRIGQAGIGGWGDMDITISGGTVNANGRYNGAGIGGDGENLRITISGGTVTATVIDVGAGIGSHAYGDVGQINITGGTVNATGGNIGYTKGAGIGGGWGGSGGSITISGGTVYAKKGAIAPYDIGDGLNGSGTTLAISGSAAVFLATDSCITPTTTHTHLTYTADTEESYGYAIPSAWTPTFGAYLRIYTLSYDLNNGSGTVPGSVTKLYNASETVAPGSGLSRTGYTYSGWNTKADGTGASVAAGDTFTFKADTTLFAKWIANAYTVKYDANGGIGTTADSSFTYDAAKALTTNGFTRAGYAFAGWATGADSPVAYSDGQSVKNLAVTNGATVTLYARWTAQPTLTPSVSGGQIYVGGRVTLTPNIPGGAWSFDAAVFSQNGSTFTALKSGSVVITYTIDGVSVSYPITVKDAELPETGQDSIWVYFFFGFGVLMFTGAALLKKHTAK